jgi:hypothetical protein
LVYILIVISGINGLILAQKASEIIAIDTLFEQKLAGQKINISSANSIGSRFIIDEWCLGDVHLITGNWVKNKRLKYDSFAGELIWLRPSDYSMIMLEKDQILEFNIDVPGNKKRMQFKKMDVGRADSLQKFYQVLYEGTYGLYCNRRVTNAEDATRNADFTTYAIPILKKAPVYIFFNSSGKSLSVEKISNRSLIKNYPFDKTIIKSLLRERHLRLKTEEDLIIIAKAFEENKLLD